MSTKGKSNAENEIATIPWQLANRYELDSEISTLLEELKLTYEEKNKNVALSQKKHGWLNSEFKNAEQSRSKSKTTMIAIAQAMGVTNVKSAVEVAEMKEWNRAAKKLQAQDRNLHDLGRGRIYIETPNQMQALYKALRCKDRDGKIKKIVQTDKISIIDDSISDYLKYPRSSGYAGAFHMDIQVDLKRGRAGKFEFQVMPRTYKDTDKVSHPLFEIIRFLKEKKSQLREQNKDLSAGQQEILDTLIRANTALFDEAAIRTGFVELRAKKPLMDTTYEQFRNDNDLVDRLWTGVNNMHGKRAAWMNKTKNSLSMAKTSLQNMFIASLNKSTSPSFSELSQ